jgi:DNA polymerase-3 subunit delta'
MIDQPINAKTKQVILDYLSAPGQAVGLIGQKWLAKDLLAAGLASQLLEIPSEALTNYPYYRNIGSDDVKAISIDDIRSINDFLSLKVPSKKAISRVIVISHAEKMKLEAQNALLKNLEEPPTGTVIILSAESVSSLLPTIASRLQVIPVYKPSKADLETYYAALEYKGADIKQALLIADGLPGLVNQLLTTEDSPVSRATTKARGLLTSTTFERLNTIDDLAKDKTELKNILFIIKQMAKIGVSSADPKRAVRWQRILAATLDSEIKLTANVQVKLLLTDYMLTIS